MSKDQLRAIRPGEITNCPQCKGKHDIYHGSQLCPTCLNTRQVIWRLQPCILPRQEEKPHEKGG